MKRIAMLIACAALLNACGGGSDQAEPQVSASISSLETGLVIGKASNADIGQAQDAAAEPASERTNLWFVEFTGAPEADGNSQSAIRAEKRAFREAAAAEGIIYTERRSFEVLFNGISVDVTPEERAKLARLRGVKAMYPVQVIHAPPRPAADGGSNPELVAAITLTGANIAHQSGWTGAGIKVGVIDTGIDIDHPDLGGSGVPGGTSLPTTRIVAGYDFVGDDFAGPESEPVPDENPDDCNGHGTHVAGIVGASGNVTGVAPGVTFGAYRVFGCEGSTTADIMLLAMERALADGMHVVNISIGAQRQWPQYPTAQGADRLVRKGVVVVASIGNVGPGGSPPDGLYAASAPGVGERVIGVASFDNAQQAFVVEGRPYGFSPATGAPPPPQSGSLLMAKTGTPTTPDDACAPLPAGSLEGRAVLIRRGTCSFYQKAFNAQQAGAAAVVLYNNQPGGLVNITVTGSPPIQIPVVGVTAAQGAELDARIEAGVTVLTWGNQYVGYPFGVGGLTSSFSSFGLSPDLSIKPNIGAPGGGIISTIPLEDGAYGSNSGTSMASPHVAGAAALVLEARPRTRARDMKGLLQNYAVPANWSGNPDLGLLDHVHRQGAGLLNIPAAINSTARVEPSELALGESEHGPFAATLTIRNDTRARVIYHVTHEPAVATGPNTFLPLTFLNAPATVAFSETTFTVQPRRSYDVQVSITAPSSVPDRVIYNGYLVFTPNNGDPPIRVPYAGFKGDYQSIQVLTPTPAGFPWLARRNNDGSFTNQPQGATFTLTGGDIPYFLAHFDHQSELVQFEAFEVVSPTQARLVGNVDYLRWFTRNSTATGAFFFAWDGTVFRRNTETPRRFRPVPDGDYIVRLTVKKALGSDLNEAHFERWISPVITIDRPAASPSPPPLPPAP